MANEITASVGLRAEKNGMKVRHDTVNLQRTMTGTHRTANTPTLSTTEEQLVVGADVATLGWAIFRNLSSTTGEYIEIGVKPASTFYPLIKLMPGDHALAPLATVNIYAKAGAGTPSLDFEILEA